MPRIETTHTGSLPRHAAVREALGADAADTDAVAAAVKRVIQQQVETGLDCINNGEQARLAYSVGVTDRLDGFGDAHADRDLPADLEDVPRYAEELFEGIDHIGGPVAEGPISYAGPDGLLETLEQARDAMQAAGHDGSRFHTAPSPGAVARFTDSAHHDTQDDYLFDLAEALRAEYAAIVDAGFHLQVDAPDLLASRTIAYKELDEAAFADRVVVHVEALNHALRDVDAGDVRMHACWGNYPGPHHHDVALDAVIDLFYEADVSGLIVEAANPRHAHTPDTLHEHPLPDGWTLVPGVIDVKTNIVEHPEVVADRLQRCAEAVGADRVMAGTDCGFETVLSANFVHPEIAWQKLEALVEGAALAEQRLA